MSRALVLVLATLLGGCMAETEPCRADICLPLQDFLLTETAFLEMTDTTTWYVEFTQRGDDPEPLRVRIECTAANELEGCVKSFTMPDLARLPHGGASLHTSSSETEAVEGSFRLTEFSLTSDGQSYRVSGRIDVLRFQTTDELIQIDEGTFDVVSGPQ